MNGNFKVRCIENCIGFTTKGKIYDVVNGVFTYDNGTKESNECFSAEELNKKFISQFELFEEDQTPSFDWESFKSGKFAVHCDTEEKAKLFLKECDAHEITWGSGTSCLKKTCWDVYKEKTCYEFYFGFGYGRDSESGIIIKYTPSITAKEDKPTIKPLSEYTNKEIAEELLRRYSE